MLDTVALPALISLTALTVHRPGSRRYATPPTHLDVIITPRPLTSRCYHYATSPHISMSSVRQAPPHLDVIGKPRPPHISMGMLMEP
jgi:hypothetical protein